MYVRQTYICLNCRIYVIDDKWNIYLSKFFFFNDTATTEIYTLSLHDALPIYVARGAFERFGMPGVVLFARHSDEDRKSTRLNSSHITISYAVFCLKKKKIILPISDSVIIPMNVISTLDVEISSRCNTIRCT